MPADLPPGALEEMERLLPLYRAATGNLFFRPQEHTLRSYLWPEQMPTLLALAREALTLRERLAGLTASLDACQAGHTHQAKRAEAAEADAARLRAALEEAAAWFREYEQMHLAKGTPDGSEKAARNAERAAVLERTLARAKEAGDAER